MLLYHQSHLRWPQSCLLLAPSKERKRHKRGRGKLFCPVQFSCSVVSDSLPPHGLQYARLPCPSPTLGVYSNSCPLSQLCHPVISSSVVPFSSCLQSLPASGSFQKSHLFASGGQSMGASVSASVLPVNIQDWFPLRWTSWISLKFKGLSRVFSSTTTLTSTHDYWKNHSLV